MHDDGKVVIVATQFVDLVLKHNWGKIKDLLADEVQVLFDIISAAGFEPREVVLGKLVGYGRDQDGSRTGETYQINELCPFMMVGQEDNGNYSATDWLDHAFKRVVYGGARKKENREELIEVMVTEIKRSVPLTPIQLTPEGDLLCEYPPNADGFVDHTRDDCKLSSCVGIHKYCGSWMDRGRATETHDAIVCRGCHIRVLFPKGILTYGGLRFHFGLQRELAAAQ